MQSNNVLAPDRLPAFLRLRECGRDGLPNEKPLCIALARRDSSKAKQRCKVVIVRNSERIV
jgi:hypothetical protein